MNKLILVSACLLALAAMVASQEVHVCAQNEIYSDCGTACPEHCAIRNARGELETQKLACIRMCVPGCACATGFVRDLKRNNECVQKSLCTAP